jgi:sirohydrochlorin cobaltochelatase
MKVQADSPMTTRSAEVPVTLLLGRGGQTAPRSIHRLARRVAGQLGHDVEPCDLEAPADQIRRIVARGTTRLVLLPVTLDDSESRAARRVDGMAAALAAWPALRVHWGQPPATDDVARMLGDRARDGARSLIGGRGSHTDVVVVIATGDGANPARNAEVAKLARLVFEAQRFADVAYAFVGLTTPSLGEVIARWARLGARRIVVVPYLLFDLLTHRRLVRQARASGANAGIDVVVARSLESHPALAWALVRRHLEALADAGLLAAGGEGTPWVNPALLRLLDHAHGHRVGIASEWEARVTAILPPRYRDPGFTVSSAPMGAAPLLRDAEGRVAWDRMWQGFCELGLAGGPPHRGTLLEAVSPDEVRASPERYAEVCAELARGLRMVTGLPVVLDGSPGWIGVACLNEEMAIWLLRAIVVENVLVRRERAVLYLPAGPRFTLEEEIKNVVTVVAKTHHYWTQHCAAQGFGTEA